MTMLLPLLLHTAMPASPPCRAASLALETSGVPADFDGMSHSGTGLRLRNRAPRACAIPAQPRLTFLDRRGQALPILGTPTGAGPAIRLAPGGTASAGLRWVSGPVYDRSRCYTPARVVLTLPSGRIAMPLAAHICGEAGKPVQVEQQPFTR